MAESEEKKTCFIIMPITTREEVVEKYGNDEKHFKHVFDHLLAPAVKKAGMEPIPPGIDGSDVIQPSIIAKLRESDLVLCDMSDFNPNVFFEFGVRTACHKPLCLVSDDHLEKPPFDVSPIHREVYKAALNPWELDDDIEKLTTHIVESVERSKGQNLLWKNFGLGQQSHHLASSQSEHPGAEYFAVQLEALRDDVRSEIRSLRPAPLPPPFPLPSPLIIHGKKVTDEFQRLKEAINTQGPDYIMSFSILPSTKHMVVFTMTEPTQELRERVRQFAYVYGLSESVLMGMPTEEL